MIELVMFDLDGTLVDSAPDIAAIINEILREQRLPQSSLARIRSWIGQGARHTMTCAYAHSAARAGRLQPLGPASQLLDQLMARYAELHSRKCGVHSRVYQGVPEALQRLRKLSVQLAVVTNKEELFARELLDAVGLAHWFPIVVGGDTLPTRKPDPAPLHYCLTLHRVAPDRALMLGDSAVDSEAANAAGVRALLVRHGYSSGAALKLHDITVESLGEFVSHVESIAAASSTAGTA